MADNEQSLVGRAVLITGASQGVGQATATRLVAEGARVTLVARGAARLEAAARELASPDRVLAVTADVGDATAMREAVARTVETFGGLDAVVLSAGTTARGPVETLALADWERTLRTNLTGAFITTQSALPALRDRGGGHVIAISSGAGKRGYPAMSAYCASKFGLMGLMESLAAEVSDAGIHCCTICPGSILTEFGNRSISEKLASGARYLQPEDVADAVIYLLTQPKRAWTQELNLWPF